MFFNGFLVFLHYIIYFKFFIRFYQSWQNFKDKNPYVNKVLDWKNKYEESDNAVIRASRLLTEKVVDIMGGLFQVKIRHITFLNQVILL